MEEPQPTPLSDPQTEESASSSTPATDETVPKLSKNAQKKLAKKQKHIETRQEWRQKEKDKKKARKRLMKEQGLPVKKKKKRVIEDRTTVIDLSFTELMTDKEVYSLSKQILHAYGANNRAKNPTRIHLTGCSDKLLEKLRTHHEGFDKWQITVDKRDYLEIFPKQDLVYLTSDTDTVLHTVDTSKVYIIGGIVDHNRLKNITVNRANEQGVATAQLPIGNYLEMKSRRVLAVNHVLEILVNVVNNGGDWGSALEATIPERKSFSRKEGEASSTTTEPTEKVETTEQNSSDEAPTPPSGE